MSVGSLEADVLKFKVTKLYEGTEYLFKVYAVNEVGQGEAASLDEPVKARLPFGDYFFFLSSLLLNILINYIEIYTWHLHVLITGYFLLVDPPGPPQNLIIEDLTKESVTLVWEPPAFDGGSPIIGYYIEKSSGYSARWIKVNREPLTKLSKTLTDLVEDSEYEYRVYAENQAGAGKPSETTGVFRAKDPFSKPERPDKPVVEEIMKEETKLSWSAPKDGGAKITNYIVEYKERTDVKWKTANKKPVTDNTYIVTGLREETEYEFRITAENKAGQSSPSSPSEAAKYGVFHLIVIINYLF